MTKKEFCIKLSCRYPKYWKLFRYMLWGKTDFNSIKEWEASYLAKEDIVALQNRVPSLVNIILEKIKSHEKIIDISAGYGNFILKVPSHIEKYATEYSTHAINYLKSQGVKVQKAILPVLPFNDNEFDIVVSISVFEHLKNEKEIRKSFEECHRICKKEFLFSVPFNCMQPWNTLEHNYDFTKKDIIRFSEGLFELKEFQIITDDNEISQRSISVLKKISK